MPVSLKAFDHGQLLLTTRITCSSDSTTWPNYPEAFIKEGKRKENFLHTSARSHLCNIAQGKDSYPHQQSKQTIEVYSTGMKE